MSTASNQFASIFMSLSHYIQWISIYLESFLYYTSTSPIIRTYVLSTMHNMGKEVFICKVAQTWSPCQQTKQIQYYVRPPGLPRKSSLSSSVAGGWNPYAGNQGLLPARSTGWPGQSLNAMSSIVSFTLGHATVLLYPQQQRYTQQNKTHHNFIHHTYENKIIMRFRS